MVMKIKLVVVVVVVAYQKQKNQHGEGGGARSTPFCRNMGTARGVLTYCDEDCSTRHLVSH